MATSKKPGRPKTAAAANATVESYAPRLETDRAIDLSDADWRWATWRKREAPPKPMKAPAFALASVIDRLRTKVKPIKNGVAWDFSLAAITSAISKEEARVWFELMLGIQRSVSPEKKAAELERKKPKLGALSFAVATQRLLACNYEPAPEIAIVLATLFSAAKVTKLLVDDKPPSDGESAGGNFFHGWREHVLPLLGKEERAALIEEIAPEIRIEKFATDPDAEYEDGWSNYGMGSSETYALDHFREPSGAFFAASVLGMHDELRAVVERLPEDAYRGERKPTGNNVPQLVIFGLGSAELVALHMKRLKLRLDHPHWVRAWLAHTEYAHLDVITETILGIKDKAKVHELAEVLALVRAPENVGPMLTLVGQSKAADVASRWLDENIGHTIQGCLDLASGSGVVATAAAARLRLLTERGHGAAIEKIAKAGKGALGALALAKHDLPILELLPKDLARPINAALMASKAKLPSFISLEGLPALEIAKKKLRREHVAGVLRAFDLDAQAMGAALRRHATAESCDAFVWSLFEQWLLAGGPPKHKWVMVAMALLAGDASALKLAPLIREWPGQSLHQRAVLGIDVLSAIGTDVALDQLSGLARTLWFPAAKLHAENVMNLIAQRREMTRDELEDTIVPHGGFDANGKRNFVYGARTFEVVLGLEATPMLRGVDGGPRIAELPEPGEGDDLVAAKRLRDEWSTLKRTLEETFKVQANRLEQSMVRGRRWSRSAFERLAAHPLMSHLARTLVWGIVDDGKVVSTFRIAEDGSFADANDDPFTLPKKELAVSVVHPLDLDPKTRDVWGSVFADYEILPPFEQLGRPIHTIDRRDADDLAQHFGGRQWPTKEFFALLRDRGWTHGHAGGGWVDTHVKDFPGSKVVACITHRLHAFDGTPPDAPQEIHALRFFRALGGNKWDPYGFTTAKLKLDGVDPRVLSEVLYDLL